MSDSDSTHADKEKAEINETQGDEPDPDAKFGGREARLALERKLLWKIDLRILGVLVPIYILNYVDRNNAGAARLRGFESDLHLKGQEFATLLSILYVGYIIMQIPSNMFLNFIGKPSLYLPGCMVSQSHQTKTNERHSFVGALLTRFFLGFVEAAFFPGALFLLSKACWYKREEIGRRTAILYCGNLISNAFGSLMASGILSGMQGTLGHAAWRWLFYIEGALTVSVAICAMFILPDFPTTTRWLTPLERALAVQRMKEDAGVGDQGETEVGGQSSGLIQALCDWRVWWMSLAMTAQVVSLSFNAYFPTLSATMGFNNTVTLLLCAPPFAFASLAAFFLSRHSDQTKERFWHVASSFGLGIVGFIIAIATMNTAARYVSLFLMAQSYAGFVVVYAWISNSFPRPPSKRAVALALMNAFSQLGNVAGSYVFPTMWGPTYRNSYAICIACAGTGIIMCWVFKLSLIRLNDMLEREEQERGVTEKGFRYIV
ncbi:MFS general substrate transporter [Lentinula aciculospora]|uniref:MFS general substrate transporter n=1 Tax=Lentinula aciculospora TaxID=153920 RepID=A0A9W9DFE4_9AGAR|nr:MFS general substrate transporter [Lentinula aciculospora]